MGNHNNKDKNALDKVLDHPLSRRRFVQVSSALAGAAAASKVFQPTAEALNDVGVADSVETHADTDVRYSVCLGCHSKCGMKVRVEDDTVLKIDGNPWHPNAAENDVRLDWETSLDAAEDVTGTMCPKGQAGVQVMYNPFRIDGPLKRVGARGSGQWKSISWDTALTEIAAELKPFFDGHEDAGNVLIPTADGNGALGSIANQVVFSPGRFQHGEKEFTDRLFGNGFGTVNARHDHTSICETSHHVAGAFQTERFQPGQKDVKHHFKPDQENSDYILWFGTNPLEANFPGQTLAKRVAKSRNSGTKHVIIDPRHSRSAALAHKWLPVKVGGDAALALGIAHRIISQGTHNVAALEAANYNAARAIDEYETSDATYLVVVSAPSLDDEWLFARDGDKFQIIAKTGGGVETLERGTAPAAQTGEIELAAGGDNVTAESVGLDPMIVGDYVRQIAADVYVAPVFQLYKARVLSESLTQYSRESGIDVDDIIEVADDFAAAAPACNANAYRGACQHTNGVSAVQAIMNLNMLVSNYEWKGGTMGGTGGHLHENGDHGDAGQLNITKTYHNARGKTGPQITRVKSHFTEEYADALGETLGVPTKRQWFPFAYNGNYQELIPSIEDGYPYPVGVLISLWNNLPYSSPASKETAYRVLTDESLVPVHVCFDIEMSEMATLADYILPDASYFERWGAPHNSPVILSKFSGWRSPVVGYYANKVGTNGKTYWQSVEDNDLHNWNYEIDWSTETGPFAPADIFLELMRRVAGGDLNNFPAFGDNAYYPTRQTMLDATICPSATNALNTAWDWAWNMLVNFACEEGTVDYTSASEVNAFIKKTVERGGWFQDTPQDTRAAEYDGDYIKNKAKASGSKGKTMHMFYEYADGDGKRYVDPFSLMNYDPLPGLMPITGANGLPVVDGDEFQFKCVTYKPMYHSQGRTDSLPALTSLEPENFLEMNKSDGRRLGLSDGDFVDVSSATSATPIRGRVRLTERIRPGVVAVSHSRGRWEINSRPYSLDDELTAFDARRGRGLQSNPIMRTDPSLPNVTLQDPIGGSSSFYDTFVKVERARF